MRIERQGCSSLEELVAGDVESAIKVGNLLVHIVTLGGPAAQVLAVRVGLAAFSCTGGVGGINSNTKAPSGVGHGEVCVAQFLESEWRVSRYGCSVLEIHRLRMFLIEGIGLDLAVRGEVVGQDDRAVLRAHRTLVFSLFGLEGMWQLDVHLVFRVVVRAAQVILVAVIGIDNISYIGNNPVPLRQINNCSCRYSCESAPVETYGIKWETHTTARCRIVAVIKINITKFFTISKHLTGSGNFVHIEVFSKGYPL